MTSSGHPFDTKPAPTEYGAHVAEYISRIPAGDVLGTLESQLEETLALVGGLSDEQADYRYAPGKWSIREIIGHLCDAERVFSYRALRFARGDKTPLAGFDDNEYMRHAPFSEVPLADLLSELTSLRRATIHFFRNLDEIALMRSGPANGVETSVRALAFIIAGHENHHQETIRMRYLT
ncbi:MAG TPA: DinB family protein [Gemmatimonadaceae bacterium]|jgi:uncharacterized damage-inducible protein DinB